MKKWLQIARMFGPMIIVMAKPELAPIVGPIMDAIGEAELSAKPGPDKLAHVVAAGNQAVSAYNAARPGHPINAGGAHVAIMEAAEAVVAVTNLVKTTAAPPGGVIDYTPS